MFKYLNTNGLRLLAVGLFLPALAGTTGCRNLGDAEGSNKPLIEELDTAARKEMGSRYETSPFKPGAPRDVKIAVAPIDFSSLANPRTSAEANRSAPVETDSADEVARSLGLKAELYYDAPNHGEMLAIRYRQPANRQLLFAPIDPEFLAKAPSIALPIQLAASDDGFVYVCARCQNEVGFSDSQCRHCGLSFAPEPEPFEGPDPGVDPGVDPDPGLDHDPNELAEGERFVCYRCQQELQGNEVECPRCYAVFYTDFDHRGTPADYDPNEYVFLAENGRWGDKEFKYNVAYSTDNHSMVFRPEAQGLQDWIVLALTDYGAVKSVVPLSGEDKLNPEKALDTAYNRGFDYVLMPKLKRSEVSFDRTNGNQIASILLWTLLAPPTSWFVNAEEYRFDLVFEMQLLHARTGAVVSGWQAKEFTVSVRDQFDQFDRGYYPLSLFWIPYVKDGGGVNQSGLRDLGEMLFPHAMNEVRKGIFKQSYRTFVEDQKKAPKDAIGRRQGRTICMLLGAEQPLNLTTQLQQTQNDLIGMEKLFKEVSGFDTRPEEQKDVRTRMTGEVLRFDTSQAREYPERAPTRSNVLQYLLKDPQGLQKLDAVDTFIFYFTGYGAAVKSDDPKLWGDGYERYLCLADTDATSPETIAKTGLALSDLKKVFSDKNVRASEIIVILDTSFAKPSPFKVFGGDVKTLPGIDVGDAVLTDSYLDDLAKRPGGNFCSVLAANTIDEPAYELHRFSDTGGTGMSLLTHAFWRGARGDADADKDNSVDLKEVTDFCVEECRRSSIRLGAYVSAIPRGNTIQMSTLVNPKVKGKPAKASTTGSR